MLNLCVTCGEVHGGPFECNCQTCDVCLETFRDEETLVDHSTMTRLCVMCAEELIERLTK